MKHLMSPSEKNQLVKAIMADEIVVYENDFPDSDNWVAAKLSQLFEAQNPSVRLIRIAAP
jgi:hypothetical protein